MQPEYVLHNGIHTPVLLTSLSGCLVGWGYGSTGVNAKRSVHVHQQRPSHVVPPLSFWKINSFPPNSPMSLQCMVKTILKGV